MEVCDLTSIVPSLWSVTGLATRTEITPVGVLVTVGTGGRNEIEYEVPVTGQTGDRLVTQVQRKTSSRMVKHHRLAELGPGLRRMTLAAWNFQGSMWVVRSRLTGRSGDHNQ